jgi:hypothetical protein
MEANMTTPKFIEFDEEQFKSWYYLNLQEQDVSPFADCMFSARHQHQCDLVVMKKLWEIIEMQKKELMFLDDACECRSVFKTQTLLASVETMIEQINKGVT